MKKTFTILFLVFAVFLAKGQSTASGPSTTDEFSWKPGPRMYISIPEVAGEPSLLRADGFSGIVQVDPQYVFTSIKLFGADGQRVSFTRQSIYRLDLGGLSRGTYFVEIANGAEKIIKRIVVE
jgi:hypothetical protein